MNKAYSRINWENGAQGDTPLNDENLNRMDAAMDAIDDRVVAMDTSKANQSTVNAMVSDVTLNTSTGVMTVTKKNGTSTTYDTGMADAVEAAEDAEAGAEASEIAAELSATAASNSATAAAQSLSNINAAFGIGEFSYNPETGMLGYTPTPSDNFTFSYNPATGMMGWQLAT